MSKRRLESVSAKVRKDHNRLGSWAKVAKKYDVTPAMAWRVGVQDYEPKDPVIRKKLGFPELIMVPVRRDKLGRFS